MTVIDILVPVFFFLMGSFLRETILFVDKRLLDRSYREGQKTKRFLKKIQCELDYDHVMEPKEKSLYRTKRINEILELLIKRQDMKYRFERIARNESMRKMRREP